MSRIHPQAQAQLQRAAASRTPALLWGCSADAVLLATTAALQQAALRAAALPAGAIFGV